jgi:hypothetical protein
LQLPQYTVIRAIANIGLVMLLVAALVSGACLACAPVKAGGCCDPAGHCKKISKTCDEQSPATLTTAMAAVELPVAAVEPIRPTVIASPSFTITASEVSPPDLCLLHSLLRV